MFVDRGNEIQRLRILADEVRKGKGRFLILEGPAGMGKSTLVEQFLKRLHDFRVFMARGRVEERYIPYSIFRSAFNIEHLADIQQEYNISLAKDIAEKITTQKRRFVFIDEPRGIFSREIFKNLGGGLIVSPNWREGIFITEMDIADGAKPYEMESRVLDAIQEYMKKHVKSVILIENINYLIYSLGIDRIEFVLRDLSTSMEDGILLVSGDLESLSDIEIKRLTAMFQNTYNFMDVSSAKEPVITLTISKPSEAVVFSDLVDADYRVSEASPLRPSLLHFHLLEVILSELKQRDVYIHCLRSLIDYNDLKTVYLWIKYLRDAAILSGTKIYLYGGDLTRREIQYLRTIADSISSQIELEKTSYGMYDSFIGYLGNVARTKPLCVVFEDIQWCDENTMQLIDYVARNIPQRILFIITYRGEDVAITPRAKLLHGMLDYSNSELMRLPPLNRDAAMKMMNDVSNKKMEEIYKKSGGNPMLIKEMAKYTSTNESFIPDTIVESIEHQLTRLDDTTLYYLRFLSVMGSEENSKDVDAILGLDWKREIENYDGFIVINNNTVRFRSTILWEYVYRRIPPDIRVRFHMELGNFYAQQSVFKAAYHYYMARNQNAIKYLKSAANESVDMYALENAIDFYRKAIEISEKFNKTDEIIEILEKLADIEELTGRYPDAIDDYTRILEIKNSPWIMWKIAKCQISIGEYEKAKNYLDNAMKDGNEELIAHVKESIGSILIHQGDMDSAENYVKEFLDFSIAHGQIKDITEAYIKMATLRFNQSQYKESLNFAKKAMENADKISNYRQIISIYNLLGAIYDVIGQPQKALEKYWMLLTLSQKAGDLKGMALAYNNMGILYYSLGNINMVKSYLEKALELHRKMGDNQSLALSYYNLSGVYADLGHYETAKEYAMKALNLYKKLGDIYHMTFTEVWLGTYEGKMGLTEEALRHIERALSIGNREKYQKLHFMALLALAQIHLKREDYNAAIKVISDATPLVEGIKEDVDVYPVYLMIRAEVLIKSGDERDAEKVLDDLRKLTERNGDRYVLGIYHVLKAILNVKMGKSGDSDFREGIGYLQKQGYVSLIADMQYEYGYILLKSRDERGKEYLKIAKNSFERMNLRWMVDKIESVCPDC